MRRVVGLPMYDLPGTSRAHDALWHGVASLLSTRGVSGIPPRLSRNLSAEELWRHPGLLLGQTCGYPLVTILDQTVKVVTVPKYRIEGATPGHYFAVVVAHRDNPATTIEEFREGKLVVNDYRSLSGCVALKSLVAPLAGDGRFFSSVRLSGSHLESLRRVASGDADLASIDIVTLTLAARYQPAAIADVKILCRSAEYPALPFITAQSTPDVLVRKLVEALEAFAIAPQYREIRDALLLDGVARIPRSNFDQALAPDEVAAAHGYTELDIAT